MGCFKNRREKVLFFLLFAILGCTNNNSVAYHSQQNIYKSLIDNAISLYIKRDKLLNKPKADYYKCYDKIIYGKSFLDKIKFGSEVSCVSNAEWQERVIFVQNKANRIDIYSDNIYKDSIFFDKEQRYLGRYYGFNNTFSYHLISKNKNYYDSFDSVNSVVGKNSFTICRFYKDEDILLHPSSESYEAQLIRDKALKNRKEKYMKLAKEFFSKKIKYNYGESANYKDMYDRENKTYTVYIKVKNDLLRVNCKLDKGECSIRNIPRLYNQKPLKKSRYN